jgi:hypothetical protein
MWKDLKLSQGGKMKSHSKLPNIIYVHIENEGDKENEFFSTTENQIDAIDGDGPTVIGTYKLVSKVKMVKVVKEV